MAKGIRVSQLAKELGVTSKDILAKCAAEKLGDTVTSHSVSLSLGLAETIRQWFSSSGGGTAVEIARPIEAETKAKVRRTRKTSAARKATKVAEAAMEAEQASVIEAASDAAVATQAPEAEESTQASAGEPKTTRKRRSAAEVTSVEQEASVTSGKSADEVAAAETAVASGDADSAGSQQPAVEESVSPSSVNEVAAAVTSSESDQNVTTTIDAEPAKASSIVEEDSSSLQEAAALDAPADAEAPGAKSTAASVNAGREEAAPVARVETPVAEPRQPAAPRPTVTLDSKTGKPTRRAVVQRAPKLVPAPAKIQGPRVVREEEPDVVAAPRRKRPISDAGSPSFTQARPHAGRGVRVADEEGAAAASAGKKGKSSRTLSNRRRSSDGRRGEAMEKLREYTEADLIERRDRLNAASAHRSAFDTHLKKSVGRGQHAQAQSIVQRGGAIEIEEPITVRTLSVAMGVKSSDIIGKLMRQGVFATVNQGLSLESAELLALDYGLELKIKKAQSLEDVLMDEIAARPVDAAGLLPRPPVVTILGHVDHGKTSLLDKIRKANVAAGEFGGITQHTAAWTVQLDDRRVTFIDTPGHEAFTAMRARGANMTDVVVLVVSAAEGVQPQTIESINHAKAAEVPIVVALNKIDRPDANPDMVLGQLAAQDLNPSEWGGTTDVIRTSAVTGQGIAELIENLHYQSELLELKYDPTAPARGTVIEARIDEGLGDIATVLVQDGVLKVGDIVLSGAGYGRIRSLVNDRGEQVAQATAGTPVMISGLSELPSSGDKFFVLDDLDRARAIAEERADQSRQAYLSQQNRVTADNLLETMKAGDIQTINLIVKGDVQGSVETLVKMLADAGSDEVKARVIHSGVGAISESDVQLAIATKGKPTDNKVAIIGFHVATDEAARVLAEQNHIDVKQYRVIYEIFDDLKKALSGMLAPEQREKLHGHVEVRQVFKVSRLGNIGGCFVTDGHVQRGSKIRLIRNGTIVAENLSIDSLKRVKDDVREVKQGLECGIKLAGYDDIKVGDVFEAYAQEMIERTL